MEQYGKKTVLMLLRLFWFYPLGMCYVNRKRNKAEKIVSPISILHLWEMYAVWQPTVKECDDWRAIGLMNSVTLLVVQVLWLIPILSAFTG